MKSKIAVLFLIVLLCLTSGCNNTSHIAEQPVPVSSSGSNEAPDQSETAQATEKTEVEQPRSTEPKDDDRSTEATAGVLDSSIQTKPASDQPNSGTTPPQVSEPSKTPDESERHPEVSAPSEKEQPTPPATEEPKPAEQPQPTEPSQEEPTEPAFDIGYWIGFAKSYAESVGLTLNSEAVYCWDNPIAAGSQCKYTERDIKGYLSRYAKDPDITDVWIWYEQTGTGSFEVYTATHNQQNQITLKRIVKVRCVFRFQGGNQHDENTFFQARNCRTAFSRDVPGPHLSDLARLPPLPQESKRKSISFLFREAEMRISTTAVLGDTPIFTI